MPIKERIAYGLGSVGGGLGQAENYVINPVFVLTLGVSPAVMSMISVIIRLCDGFIDVAVGWLMDRTRSRFGRQKPYIAIGAVLVGLWLPVLFLVDPAWSPAVIIGWLVSVRLVADLFDSIYGIPYQTMLFVCTPNSVERTNVATWRGYMGIVSMLSLSWVYYLTQLPVFADVTGKVDIVRGAFWVLSGFGLVGVICMLMPLFLKQRTSDEPRKKTEAPRLTFRENLRLTFTSRPFLVLIAFSFCLVFANNVKGALDFYARMNYVFAGDQKLAATVSGFGGTASHILAFAGIPVFQWLARRKGKIFALRLIVGVGFFSSLSTLVFYAPGMPYLSLLPGLLLAPTGSAIWILVPSMLGDVCDDDELRTHEQRSGSLAAIYSWCFKMSTSLALLASGVVVELVGYDSGLKDQLQAEPVVTNLRIAVAFIPALFMGLAWWAIGRSPLTLARVAEIEAARRARSQATTT